LHLDGILYFRVIDPYKASYGVEDPLFAITQLAQTTMRSELGKIALDDVFRERDALNLSIVESINSAASVWGIKCLRYEIRDIQLPTKVLESMQMQVEAERKKRATVLESEGERESQINRATGEANAILAKANARAEAIERISSALSQKSGERAASLSVAEQYIQAFSKLAKTTNTVVLPANVGDASSMVAQAMAVFSTMSKTTDPKTFGTDPTSPSGASSSSSPNSFDDLGFSTQPQANNSYKDTSYNNNKHGEFTLANSPTRKK